MLKNKIYVPRPVLFLFITVLGVIFVERNVLSQTDTTRILVPETELALGGPALVTGYLAEKDLFFDDEIRIKFSVTLDEARFGSMFSYQFNDGFSCSTILSGVTRRRVNDNFMLLPEFDLLIEQFLVENNCEFGDAEFFWELRANDTIVSRRNETNLLGGVKDGDSILIQAQSIHKVREYDYDFLSGNKLIIKAHFINVTSDLNFLQPFFFTLNRSSGGFESANLPLSLTDQALGGNSFLSPGEVTSVVTFEVFHNGTPFGISVDANAIVQESPTITVEKSGSGTINSSPPGINCGTDCEETYELGTVVMLTASPDADFKFDGWTGCDSTTNANECIVNLTSDRTVTATFKEMRTLTVTGSGAGTIVGPGIFCSCSVIVGSTTCAGDCDESLERFSLPVITATPLSAVDSNGKLIFYKFAGWTNCSGLTGDLPGGTEDSGTCVVSMYDNRNVTAIFVPK